MTYEVNLYVQDNLVETIAVQTKPCYTVEHRIETVEGAAKWLKYKYWASIRIYSNWEIIAIVRHEDHH